MKNILAISLFWFSSAALALDCENGVERLQTHGDGYSLWCEREGVREGAFEEWSTESGLVVRGQYSHGVLDGKFLRFASDGSVTVEGWFHEGRMEGEWIRHFDNGRLKDRGAWHAGEPVGRWAFYAENGFRLRTHDFSKGASLVPRWQFAVGASRAQQFQGDFTSGLFGLSRCVWCDNGILVPRFDASLTWLKIQEEGTRMTAGLHLGFEFAMGPVIFRPLSGFEYLNSDHIESSFGVEFTRNTARSFRSTELQPFFRYLHVELGHKSDIELFQAGLWLTL